MNHPMNSKELRRTVLKMAHSGSTVHIGCAFSIIEILAVLYRSHLRGAKTNPVDRDYLVLSKGHGVMAQYACLREVGILSEDDIKNYFKDGTRLKGLSDAHIEGLEVTSGSLGHGMSVGVGMALAAQIKKTDQFTYCIVGDGECNEGAIWEACLFAQHWKLDRFVLIIDANGYQAMGTTDEVMALGDLEKKLNSFGFDAVTIDGHSESAIDAALNQLKPNRNGRPKAIVANTIKGKGVSFMEANNVWHYTRLNDQTLEKALKELEN